MTNHKYRYRESLTAYLLLVPGFILMTTFVVIPMILAVYRSFYEYSPYRETQIFVGFDNFIRVLTDSTFLKSLVTGIRLSLIIMVLVIVLSFFLAMALKKVEGLLSSLTKVVIYIPFLFSGIVASIVFLFIVNYRGGLINAMLVMRGEQPIAFAIQGLFPYLSIIIPTIWMSIGYNTLVMYAGMKNIPSSYYEAAMIDGANAFQRTRYITLPGIKNYAVLLIIGLTTANLQMFEVPFMMTGGGPLDNTVTPVLFLFNSFRDPTHTTSMTIAAALVIMIPIVVLNLFVFKLIKSEKSLEG